MLSMNKKIMKELIMGQKIDQLVYQLYGLTDDEIKIVEGKQYLITNYGNEIIMNILSEMKLN